MAAPNLATSYTGISNIETIPSEQRIYGRTSEILKITQGRIPFMRIMTNKLQAKGKTAVDDMEFKYKTDYPRNPAFDVANNSGATDGGIENVFYVKDKQAAYIEPGATLLVHGIWLRNNSGTLAYETTMGTSGATFAERVLVLNKLTSNGTYTGFKVARGFGNPWGAAVGTPAEVTTSMKLILLPKSQAEGNNEGSMYGDTPYEEYNYCEVNLEKWGQSRLSKNVKMYQTQSQMERNGERQLDLFWKKVEMRNVFGIRSTSLNANNERQWWTGGLDEYVETSQPSIGYDKTNNVIDFLGTYGLVSYQTINQFARDLFYYGSDRKWWIMDDKQYVKLVNAFENKIRINYSKEMSLSYGFDIEEFKVSGGILYLAVSDAFSIYGLSDLSYIIDFDYFKHVHLQNEDFTIMLDVEKGLNPLKQVNYLYMNSGIYRTNPFAMRKVYNLAGT